MGTGIVFVVLVAIWAAYFLQYWSRRREHLATARSVEAFSEAMRVLERRPALRASTDSRISPAYAVSPARVVSPRPAPRPQVMAKPHSPAPQHPRGGDPSMRMPTLPRITARQSHPGEQSHPQQSRPEQQSRPAARAAQSQRTPGRTGGSGRPARPTGMRPSRQVRGLAFLGLVAATLITVALAALGIVLWIAPAGAAVAMLGSLVWLRAGVQAEIRARRATRRPVRRTRPGGAARPAGNAAATRGSRPASSFSQAGEEHEVADLGREDELRSSTTVLAESDDSAASQADEEVGPDGWSPVPVPPPTYTLKAKAERPAPALDSDLVQPETFEVDGSQHETAQSPEQQRGSEQRAAYGT